MSSSLTQEPSVTQETAIFATNIGKKKRSGKGGGQQNFNERDIDVLFELTNNHVPIRKNNRFCDTSHHDIHATKNKRSIRDLDDFGVKFDRFTSTRMTTAILHAQKSCVRQSVLHVIYSISHAPLLSTSQTPRMATILKWKTKLRALSAANKKNFLQSHIGACKRLKSVAKFVGDGLSAMPKSLGKLVDVLSVTAVRLKGGISNKSHEDEDAALL